MSVTNQTMTEGIECIIVDDCGPDNSAAIAKRFVDSYQGDIRFTFIQREKFLVKKLYLFHLLKKQLLMLQN